jgi:hypothetical protein
VTNDYPLNVLITVDTETWCDGWRNIDSKFPDAFRRYIYGTTPRGDYGLPFQLKVLNDNGLRGVYFVEPLFATRFGLAPLEEIIGLVRDAGQSVELHLHTEWVDESLIPIFPAVTRKRQHMHQFSFVEQCLLLEKGVELLASAGSGTLKAFRAGSFGANNDTLRALATTTIDIDSSFNSTALPCEIKANEPVRQPSLLEGVLEVPLSVYTDGIGRQRPVQLTACSFGEMKAVLQDAQRFKWSHFVILMHSSELLNDGRTHRNPIVVRRFVKLCEYLSARRDRFPTVNFSSPTMLPYPERAGGLSCATALTLRRVAEQVWSRLT